MTTKKENFHADFNDPDADFIIECKDGIKLKVHSYILKAHSEYFRAMPSCADSPSTGNANLVHLDCDSDDLALVLKYCDKIASEAPSWDRLRRTFELGERYQFKHICDMVRSRAFSYIDKHTAIPLFQFAAKNDYLDLAKHAIVAMARATDVHRKDTHTMPLWVYECIPCRYGVALILAIGKHKEQANVPDHVRWNKISADFVLGRRIAK